MGFEPAMSTEYEFFIFKEDSHSVRTKGYKDMIPLSPGMFGYSVSRTGTHSELANSLMDSLLDFGIPLEGFHTETGPGVYEAAIRYDTALAAADKSALFKSAVKQLVARRGLIATFMAKWNQHLPGCGGHLHQSLWDPKLKKNLFSDVRDPHRMSPLMKHYMAGQLELMAEMTALICPTVNSYKRLVPNTWAPNNASWGFENRTTALRAISGPSAKSTRVEYRLAGADLNPYIAMAASLAAGLYGVQKKLTLTPTLQAECLHRTRCRQPPDSSILDRGYRKAERQRSSPGNSGRGIRFSLHRHARVGSKTVSGRHHRLGAGTLLRDHLTRADGCGCEVNLMLDRATER